MVFLVLSYFKVQCYFSIIYTIYYNSIFIVN